MLDIEETINAAIKKRPLMYVSELRLDLLYYYLAGVFSDIENTLANNLTKDFYTDFFNWVYDWARKEDSSYTYDSKFWYRMIYDNTNSEEEAVDTFFKLCDSYFQYWHKMHPDDSYVC